MKMLELVVKEELEILNLVVGLIILGVLIALVLYYLYKNKNFVLSQNEADAIYKKNIDYLDLSDLEIWFNENNQSYPNARRVVTLLDDNMIKKMKLSKELQGKKCLMLAFVGENDDKSLKAVIIIYKEMSQSLQKRFTDAHTLILK